MPQAYDLIMEFEEYDHLLRETCLICLIRCMHLIRIKPHIPTRLLTVLVCVCVCVRVRVCVRENMRSISESTSRVSSKITRVIVLLHYCMLIGSISTLGMFALTLIPHTLL